MTSPRLLHIALLSASAAALAGCTLGSTRSEAVGPATKENVVGITASNQLVRFNAGQPQRLLSTKALQGLREGDRILGADFRVARGQLFALGSSGQLYRVDVEAALATPVGTPVALPSPVASWGVDFNPTVDRLRVVGDTGVNLRLHPDTGAIVDGNADQPGTQLDGRLAYDAGDAQAGKTPAIVAAAYTYNKTNDKITTNYALDGAQGLLVHQGTKEGVTPAVSPNTGRLFSVGSLGIGSFTQAVFDISDVSNAAFAGADAGNATRWYRIDLETGRATPLGTVAGERLVGAAIEP